MIITSEMLNSEVGFAGDQLLELILKQPPSYKIAILADDDQYAQK